MIRAALYGRVSTDRQAEKYGLEAQLTALRQRAAARNLDLVRDGDRDAFWDDGFSGGDLDRPALARLRSAVRQGGVDTVLCHDPDRLSRSLTDLLLLSDEFAAAGVRLEFVTQEMDASPEGKMFFAIRGAVAEYERAKIRERTARGRTEKARQGQVINPRNLPYGYTTDGSGGVAVDEEQAQVVRLAFHLLGNEGMTLGGIARRLTELGVRTPQGGARWRAQTLQWWLRNPAYKGDYLQLRFRAVRPGRSRASTLRARSTLRREVDPATWSHVAVPPVVAQDLWERVQPQLQHNRERARRNTKREYLLQGLVRCACGRKMTGRFHGHRRYRCAHHGPDPAGASPAAGTRPSVRADTLESVVWDQIATLLKDPQVLLAELRARQEAGSPTREALELEQRAARRRLAEIPKEQARLVEGYGKGLVPDDLLEQRLAALREEQTAVEQRLEGVARSLRRLGVSQQQEDALVVFANRVSRGLEALDFRARQAVLRDLVEEVVVGDAGVTIRAVVSPGHPSASDLTGVGPGGHLYPDHRGGSSCPFGTGIEKPGAQPGSAPGAPRAGDSPSPTNPCANSYNQASHPSRRSRDVSAFVLYRVRRCNVPTNPPQPAV